MEPVAGDGIHQEVRPQNREMPPATRCFGLREEEAGSGSSTSLGSAVGDTDTRVESEAIRDGAVGSASIQTSTQLRRPPHTDSPKSAPLIPLAP